MLKKHTVSVPLSETEEDTLNKYLAENKIDDKNVISIRMRETRNCDFLEVWVREEDISEEDNDRFWGIFSRTSSAGPG